METSQSNPHSAFLMDTFYYYYIFYYYSIMQKVLHCQSTENMVERDLSPSCLTQYYLWYRVLMI